MITQYMIAEGREALRIPPGALSTYVATNSIRHLEELYSSKFVRFSISNFERSVLLCIEADLRDQIRVGKRLTRSIFSYSSRDFNKKQYFHRNFGENVEKFATF